MWHHELAKVYQVRQNLWAIDEIGKTTLYVYEGSLWLTPMPMATTPAATVSLIP